MTILFVSLKNPFDSVVPVGGAETSIKQIACGFAAEGHTVYYLTTRASAGSREVAKELGITLVSYSGPASWRQPLQKIMLLHLVVRISLLIISRRIESIYCYYEVFAVGLIHWVGKIFPRVFITMRIAGQSWMEFRRLSPWHDRIYRATFQRVNQFNYIHAGLVPLTTLECLDAEIAIEKAQTFVGDIGVPVSTMKEIGRSESPTSNGFTVLVPARFSRPKRQDLVIEALSLLPKDLPFTVQFAGEGALEAKMVKLAKKILSPKQYVFLGFVPQEELWRRIGAADLVLIPTDREGLSKTTLESMALGTPVMASNVVPLDQYIQPNQTGFLVENTPEAWALELERVAASRERRDIVRKQALEFVSTNYSLDLNMPRYQRKLLRFGFNRGKAPEEMKPF